MHPEKNEFDDLNQHQQALRRMQDFLDSQPQLEPARKTWLTSLFATLITMGNFTLDLHSLETPIGQVGTDAETASPGASGP